MGEIKVYISGPIAHYDIEERKQAFALAEKRLMDSGFCPINPFNNGVSDDAHWTKHMKADINMLTGCDAIVMLPGWQLSKGAKLEFDVATSCGIEVLQFLG